MEDKILTLHPGGKKGTNIDRMKYEVVKDFLMVNIKEHKEISYSDLSDWLSSTYNPHLKGK